MDVGALGHLDSGDEIGEGNADDDLAAGVLDSGDQLADEALASVAVLFIFQLPAMIALRFCLSMVITPSIISLPPRGKVAAAG